MAITQSPQLNLRTHDFAMRAGAFLLINHSGMSPKKKRKAKQKWLKDYKWKWKKNEECK